MYVCVHRGRTKCRFCYCSWVSALHWSLNWRLLKSPAAKVTCLYTLCFIKTATFLQLRQKWSDLNNFCYTQSCKHLTLVFAHLSNTVEKVTPLPCEKWLLVFKVEWLHYTGDEISVTYVKYFHDFVSRYCSNRFTFDSFIQKAQGGDFWDTVYINRQNCSHFIYCLISHGSKTITIK